MFGESRSLVGPYLIPPLLVAAAASFEVTAALGDSTVRPVLQGQPPLLRVSPEPEVTLRYFVVQLVLGGLLLSRIGPEAEAALRYFVVQLVLERLLLSRTGPEAEAARRYSTVPPLLQGRAPLSPPRSALQAYWLGFGLELPRAPLGTWRQT